MTSFKKQQNKTNSIHTQCVNLNCLKGTGERVEVSRSAEQDEAASDVLAVEAVDGGLCIVGVGQESKAVAC